MSIVPVVWKGLTLKGFAAGTTVAFGFPVVAIAAVAAGVIALVVAHSAAEEVSRALVAPKVDKGAKPKSG